MGLSRRSCPAEGKCADLSLREQSGGNRKPGRSQRRTIQAIPATRFGVAGTIVATSLGENGLNVVHETEDWIAGCRVNGDWHMAYDVSAGVARSKGAAWFHGKPEDPCARGGDPRLIRSS